MSSSSYVRLGTIVRAHGIRGMVRVHTGSDAIRALKTIMIGRASDASDIKPWRIVMMQPERTEFLVQLEGVVDRNAAEALAGSSLWARREELPVPDAGEVYVADLIGCVVFDQTGQELGTVTETFPSGAHEVLVVKSATQEFMLPLVDHIVPIVDVAGRRIVCDPPEGLIEANLAPPKDDKPDSPDSDDDKPDSPDSDDDKPDSDDTAA